MSPGTFVPNCVQGALPERAIDTGLPNDTADRIRKGVPLGTPFLRRSACRVRLALLLDRLVDDLGGRGLGLGRIGAPRHEHVPTPLIADSELARDVRTSHALLVEEADLARDCAFRDLLGKADRLDGR